MRSSNAVILCGSDGVVLSYLVELRKIAINFPSLSSATSERLKDAGILLGSRRVRRKEFGKAVDHAGDDKEDQDMEYDLLAPNQVAVVDDMIAYQQFGGAIFCAPQETNLEGEYGNASLDIPCQPWKP